MVNDAIDYHELQTGERNEGIVYSTYSFFRKLASAISGSLSSFVLGASLQRDRRRCADRRRCERHLEELHRRLLPGLRHCSCILFFVYPLTKQKTAEMLTELKSRRAAKESK